MPKDIDLRAELCARYTRTVTNDNTVRFNGAVWQIHPPRGRWHLIRAKVDVQERFHGTIRFRHPQYGDLRTTRLEE